VCVSRFKGSGFRGSPLRLLGFAGQAEVKGPKDKIGNPPFNKSKIPNPKSEIKEEVSP
jgi:hypothetical protein